MPRIRYVSGNKTIYLFCINSLAIIYCLGISQLASENQLFSVTLNYMEWIIYAVLVIKIVMCGYSAKELFIYTFVGVFFFIAYIHTGYAAMLRTFLVIIAAKNEDFKKILQVLMLGLIWGILIVIFLYAIGLSDAGIQRRGSLAYGFNSPNIFAGVIQTIVFIWIVLVNRRLKQREWLVVWGVGGLILLFLNSRATVVTLFMLPIVLSFFYKVKGKCGKSVKILLMIIPGIYAFLTYFMAALYEKSFIVQSLNLLLGSRIFMNYYNYIRYGITLFGSHINLNNGHSLYNPITGAYSTFNTLDGSYISVLLEFGIVATFIWLIFYIALIKESFESNLINLLVVTLFICTYGLVESSTVDIIIGFVLMYLNAFKTNYHSDVKIQDSLPNSGAKNGRKKIVFKCNF